MKTLTRYNFFTHLELKAEGRQKGKLVQQTIHTGQGRGTTWLQIKEIIFSQCLFQPRRKL